MSGGCNPRLSWPQIFKTPDGKSVTVQTLPTGICSAPAATDQATPPRVAKNTWRSSVKSPLTSANSVIKTEVRGEGEYIRERGYREDTHMHLAHSLSVAESTYIRKCESLLETVSTRDYCLSPPTVGVAL